MLRTLAVVVLDGRIGTLMPIEIITKFIAENSELIYATRSYKDQMLNFRPYLVPF